MDSTPPMLRDLIAPCDRARGDATHLCLRKSVRSSSHRLHAVRRSEFLPSGN